MKRYKYYILSLAVLCSFSACDSLLNEDPLYSQNGIGYSAEDKQSGEDPRHARVVLRR